MSEAQLENDLAYVRRAVERQRRVASPAGIMWLWAAYVLLGYALLDQNERAGGLFLAIAGPICGVISWIIGAAAARREGERDAREGKIEALHWCSILLGIAAIVALAAIHPILRSNLGGQLIVVVIGMVYFLYGVHRDRAFLFLGPILIAGGVAVSFIPVYPWTLLGIVIAAGLVTPTFFRRRNGELEAQPDVAQR
jgi:hypothetical protein